MTTYVRSNMCELIFKLYVVFDFTDIHFVTAYDELSHGVLLVFML